jgi:hypothetical protein
VAQLGWRRQLDQLQRNLAITQFYFVGVHPTDDDRLLGATQDNGTLQYSASSAGRSGIAGDGGATLYAADDPRTTTRPTCA